MAADTGTLVDVEDGVLVGVERDGLAVTPDVVLGGVDVIERRLTLDEAQPLQPAGSIVDIGQHRARWSPIFEPLMIGTVELDQFSIAVPARSGLLDRFAALGSRPPAPGLAHQQPQRLATNHEAVTLVKLLAGQGRTKVGVMLAHQ